MHVQRSPPPSARTATGLLRPVGRRHVDRPGRRLSAPTTLLGPAFVAAIAYVDPGNFVTNVNAGVRYGYTLLWVVVLANLVAMLVQALSAKLGLATGRSLAELCRERYPRPVAVALWLQAEVVAMATDLAEVVGGALGLHLLLGLPLLPSGLIVGAAGFVLLAARGRSQARFERVVAVLLGLVLAALAYELSWTGIDLGRAGGGLRPHLAGGGALLLATGIVGATVMPHAIYLHSDLSRDARFGFRPGSRAALRALRLQRLDVVLALGVAGLVNAGLLVLAARAPVAAHPADAVAGLHAALAQVAQAPAVVFALALLIAGLASTGVGTYAGQVVMEGFLGRRVPLWLRRSITLAPALAVLATGISPEQALVLSQVLLSFGIPFALVPLLMLTRSRAVMGPLVNRRVTTVAAGACTLLVVGMAALLLIHPGG